MKAYNALQCMPDLRAALEGVVEANPLTHRHLGISVANLLIETISDTTRRTDKDTDGKCTEAADLPFSFPTAESLEGTQSPWSPSERCRWLADKAAAATGNAAERCTRPPPPAPPGPPVTEPRHATRATQPRPAQPDVPWGRPPAGTAPRFTARRYTDSRPEQKPLEWTR